MAPQPFDPSQRIDINAIIEGFVDRGIWLYYDTISEAAAATLAASYSPFQIPIGQGTPAKTKLQTNMTAAGQFPAPRCLILDQIGLYFSSDVLKADIDLVLRNYFLEFRISEKIYFEGPLWQFSPGFGVVGASTKTNESAWTLGMVDFNSATRRFGNYAKYIAPNQQFSFSLICPGTPPTLTAAAAGGTGLLLLPFLSGLTDRAVQ